MSRADRTRNEPALKPIGVTLAAVIAGLGGAGRAEAVDMRAAPEPTASERAHYVDPTNDPRLEEAFILGPSEPIEPFSQRPAPAGEPDLFTDAPLSPKG